LQIVDRTQLSLAAAALNRGELVVVPTRRWYMVCCRADDASACEAIFAAKRRPLDKRLLLALKSREAAHRLFHIGRDAEALMMSLWPGDLALLLTWRSASLGKTYAATGAEVALVGSPDEVFGELTMHAEAPLAATSANLSGSEATFGIGPAISVPEVLAFVTESAMEVGYVIDGGICPQFVHMTIADCSDPLGDASIVREGAVHRRVVESVLQPARSG